VTELLSEEAGSGEVKRGISGVLFRGLIEIT
jgi:hypothetical protein